MTARRTAALFAITALLLTGCAPDEDATPQAELSPTVTPKSTPTPKPTPSPTPVISLPPVPPDLAALRTVTMDVVHLEQPEPGAWIISTLIVDPRGDDGSAEARLAIAVCERAVELGATRVSVLERDDSTFVVYGHPSYGNVCTEI